MPDHEHGAADPKPGDQGRKPFLGTPSGLALCVFLAAAAVFLWLEHRAHLAGTLPLLLPLLVCIGMHFFMHRGHGGHGGGRRER